MKNIKNTIYILVAITSSMLFTSCVHDEKEIFDDSASNRIDKAVKEYKEILESSPNGWHMVLWTGANYSGGGYNMFVKFKDGKVSIQSDIAPADMICRSDYTIGKNQGPVLTFNTYNTLMHYMSEASSTMLNGNEGDFEFVIQRATNDSIFLKGTKWGNKTVLTRVKEGTDIAATINKMQANLKSFAGYYADDSDVFIIDPSTHRFYMNTTNNAVPYVTTENGISLLYSVKGNNGSAISSLEMGETNKVLKSRNRTFNYTEPEGYLSIDKWVGDWQLRYIDYDAGAYAQFAISFEKTADLIDQEAMGALNGYFMIDDYKFELITYYSPITGGITIPAQYIADPSGAYGMFLLLGTDASQDALSWYAVDWNSTWDNDAQSFILEGDNSQSNGLDMNTLQMLQVDDYGNLVGNSDGQAVALISLPYVDYLTKK